MFGGKCTLPSYIFSTFEWQEAFLDKKSFAILTCVSVGSGREWGYRSEGHWIDPSLCSFRFQKMMRDSRKITFG
jgi:hypothetical protein